MSPQQIEEIFGPVMPTRDAMARIEAVDDHLKAVAHYMLQALPPSDDRDAAIQKLREAKWYAESAIARG